MLNSFTPLLPYCLFTIMNTERDKNRKPANMVINDLKLISDRLSLDEAGNIKLDNWTLDPFFEPIIRIKNWSLFLTFHYRWRNLYEESAEKERRMQIHTMFNNTRLDLGLSSNDLQYYGVTEMQGGRCHTHTVCLSKSGADPKLLIETVKRVQPYEMFIPNKNTEEKATDIIQEPLKLISYISKINKNDLECKFIHHSKDFINFYKNYVKYQVT